MEAKNYFQRDFCTIFTCLFRVCFQSLQKCLNDSNRISPIVHLKGSDQRENRGSGVTSTLGTWYGGVVMGVLLSFNEAAILYRDFNSAPSQKQNTIVFAANNSRCCECHVAPTIIL
jgi:hypothetical protein